MTPRGFTLLEMLVVIGIVGLIGGIAFPALDRTMQAQTFQTITTQADLAVRTARADAIRTGATVTVLPFDSRTMAVALGARTLRAPALRIEQPDVLRFFADGTSSGGVVQFAIDRRMYRIVIDPQTGVVTSGRM
ncbi:MAG: prepilin-type N-terminal cleavage/methylation domain-containing protein [Sphingomonadaceae bacterium]